MNDVKHAFRRLLNSPGFTLIVVMILAIGIAANTSMFSVVNTVVLNPLPYPDSDRLVRMFETDPARETFRHPVSIPNFLAWQEQSQSFECLGLVNYGGYVSLGEGSPRVKTLRASSTLFSALDVKPVLGRIFTAEEDKPNSDLMLLLSYDLWQSQFAADPDIIGRQFVADGSFQCTVVGVLPADFEPSFYEGFEGNQCWLSLSRIKSLFDKRNYHTSSVVGKLKRGVTLSQAQTEMDGIAAQIATYYGEDSGVRIVSVLDDLVKDVDTILWILFAAVGFLLMIVCVNVANLLLTKISSRDREMAVRAALGAGRWRLMQQLFIESLLLVILGGTLGILLAFWGNQLLFAWLGDRIPWMVKLSMDGRVLAFTALASLLSCVLFSLAPAIHLLGCKVLPVLQNSAGRSTSSRYRVLQDALVVIQISMALVLLIGAGLLGRSFVSLMRTDLGMTPENVLTFQVDLPQGGQFRETRARSAFLHRMESELQALPGVHAVGSTSLLSFTASWNRTGFSVIDGLPTSADVERVARFRAVSPDYLETIGTKLVRGRFFNERDAQGTVGKMIVNETMAQCFWPDQNPLGTRLDIEVGVGEGTPSSYEIVGIVADAKQMTIQEDIKPEMSVLNAQFPPFWALFAVKTDVEPLSQVNAIRKRVANLDKTVPISDVRTLQGRINDTIWRERFSLMLTGFFSVTALLLASLGVYGVMAHAVTLRRQEIGIRIALGAQRGNVLGLILKRGSLLAGIGIAMGIFGALALTRIMEFMLYQVKPLDPVTFAVVPLLLVAVTLVACYIPARRATRIDPMVALRCE